MAQGKLHVLRWGGHCTFDVSKIYFGIKIDRSWVKPRSSISKDHIPRLLLGNPEIRRLTLLLAKTNVIIMSADELVSQGLEAGEEERGRSGEMRHSQGQMGDGHVESVGSNRVQANVLKQN